MPFPSPSLTAPTLSTWQMSYKELTFGGIVQKAPYQLTKIEGLDMPVIASGDVQRALDQGQFAGLDLLEGRDITITLTVTTDATSLGHARQQLGAVFGVAGATESPLYVQLPSGIYACMARPRKYNFPLDINTLLAKATPVTALLHATDPRFYAAPSKTATVGLPQPLGGLYFNVSFNAEFGGGGTGGILQIYNNGTFEMRPIFIINGPCTNPKISNLSLSGSPTIGFNITLAEGERLEVETDFQGVTLYTSASTTGTSRRNTLMNGSTWFNLPPGLSQIEFTTSDGAQVAGTLTCQSADAYASL